MFERQRSEIAFSTATAMLEKQNRMVSEKLSVLEEAEVVEGQESLRDAQFIDCRKKHNLYDI